MRRLILLMLLASMAPYAGAEKRVTVAQLEQALTAAHSANKPDAEIARQIGGLELSERLTEATLNRLTAYLDAGSQAALALQLLADQSAFLDPPASEVPSTAAPDDAAQQRMIDAARSYVAKTVPQLPNLFAMRTTNRYDDRPQEVKKGGWPVRAGLHLVSTSSRDISIFDERTNESTTAASAHWQEQSGLISGGEFGSTLSMILTDTLKGKVTWSHWEQTTAGQVAVFHYSVPSSASHFEVISSLQRQASLEGTARPSVGSRQGSSIEAKASGGGSNASTFLTGPAITDRFGWTQSPGPFYAPPWMPIRKRPSSRGPRSWCIMARFRSARVSSFARCGAWLSPWRSTAPIWILSPACREMRRPYG